MKFPSVGIRHRKINVRGLLPLAMAVLLFFFIGTAVWASGGEADGPKGWVSTDTFRVLNFAVLAIVLFFILRKPISRSLNSRIKGIIFREQELFR